MLYYVLIATVDLKPTMLNKSVVNRCFTRLSTSVDIPNAGYKFISNKSASELSKKIISAP